MDGSLQWRLQAAVTTVLYLPAPAVQRWGLQREQVCHLVSLHTHWLHFCVPHFFAPCPLVKGGDCHYIFGTWKRSDCTGKFLQ